MKNLIRKILKEEITELEEKKIRAKNLIKKMLDTKTTEPTIYEEDLIKLEKKGQKQLEYQISNISSFVDEIYVPTLTINYYFYQSLINNLPLKNILDEEEVIQTIIDWFNSTFSVKVNPNSWYWATN
jgi:hypothetical protein